MISIGFANVFLAYAGEYDSGRRYERLSWFWRTRDVFRLPETLGRAYRPVRTLRSAEFGRRMGRPRKTTDKRAWQLNLKLTRAEFDAIGIRATARGLHPVDYGRLMLLRPSEHNALSPIERSRWDQAAVLQLQKLGNLLNQAIRHLHRTHELLPEIAGLLRDIRIEINRSTS